MSTQQDLSNLLDTIAGLIWTEGNGAPIGGQIRQSPAPDVAVPLLMDQVMPLTLATGSNLQSVLQSKFIAAGGWAAVQGQSGHSNANGYLTIARSLGVKVS